MSASDVTEWKVTSLIKIMKQMGALMGGWSKTEESVRGEDMDWAGWETFGDRHRILTAACV